MENTRLVLAAIKENVDKPEFTDSEKEELWIRIDRFNRGFRRRKVSFFAAIASVAAAVALLFVLNPSWYSEERVKEIDYYALMESARQAGDTREDVGLILAGKTIYRLEGDSSEVEFGKGEGVRVNSVQVVQVDDEKTRRSAYNALFVPAGKRSTLTLSDGTKISVNSGSTVIFPTRFGDAKREIFVEGEAYFDVFRNDCLPFVVKTGKVDINVLGTQFNVMSLADDPTLEVVLVSGRVEVAGRNSCPAVLAPEEMYRYDVSTGEGSVSRVDVADHVAWIDGYYPFKSQSLDVVLTKIARYYGLDMEWSEKVSELTLSGKLDLRDDPAEVLSLLARAAPITVIERDGKYIIFVNSQESM